MNKVVSGFFAATDVTDPNGHVTYNWWHSSDHIPENLALEGVVLGTRWAAPKRYVDARWGSDPMFAEHQYLVHYLMVDPLEKSLRDFHDLGSRTRDVGRYFANRTLSYAAHHRLLKSYSSPTVPISPEAVSFRPPPRRLRHGGRFCRRRA